ncbi:hypothetical protein DOT_3768 [Desulfosporosinus sp. OT]|nr:hypothetical protein DOT_3768 [Desulfosporosinus sp. OT]
MQVTVVVSSMEALEVLKSETFGVLMFDLNMPVIYGLELTRRVLATNSDTPIIIYTGYDITSAPLLASLCPKLYGFRQINCIPHADCIDYYVKCTRPLELVLKSPFAQLTEFTKKTLL